MEGSSTLNCRETCQLYDWNHRDIYRRKIHLFHKDPTGINGAQLLLLFVEVQVFAGFVSKRGQYK